MTVPPHPLLATARTLAHDLLAPNAERVREAFALVDLPRTANASPAVFGVALAALRLVGEAGERESARAPRSRLDEVRGRVYAPAAHPVPHERIAERLELKTRAYDLMGAATTAAVVAGGGCAMDLGSPAQRLAREGLFLLA